MARSKITRFHILMQLSGIGDKSRHDTIAGIVQQAPTSPLFANPAIQASVTELATQGAALKANNDTVAAGRTKLASDIEIEAVARNAVDRTLLTIKSLVENNATQAADIASMGFQGRGAPPPKGPFAPPERIDIRPGKVRGQFRASAHEVGKVQWKYAAECSPDPLGEDTWTTLPGYGKARKVTGPSGAKVWVRFARVRGQVQSDWSTPVLVTIP